METRRVGTTLAACALIALGACSKEVGNNAEAKPGVGAKVDRAIERTEQKLSTAGERAKEGVAEATEKTQDALSRATESLKGAKPGEVPYAPRQAVPDAAAPAAAAPAASASITTAVPADNPATTTTLSSGPTTTIKATGIPPDTRAVLNDAAITASIKADLLRDPDLSVLKIDVDTRDGVVTLNGLAGNDAAKSRAERMAQSVKGVREVRNRLTIKQA